MSSVTTVNSHSEHTILFSFCCDVRVCSQVLPYLVACKHKNAVPVSVTFWARRNAPIRGNGRNHSKWKLKDKDISGPKKLSCLLLFSLTKAVWSTSEFCSYWVASATRSLDDSIGLSGGHLLFQICHIPQQKVKFDVIYSLA